jgi:hypothetical protein
MQLARAVDLPGAAHLMLYEKAVHLDSGAVDQPTIEQYDNAYCHTVD